jgi:N-acetylglucosamine malate deacetylase 2
MTSTALREPHGRAMAGIYSAGWLTLHAQANGSKPSAWPARSDRRDAQLPRADRILVVTARPGQESADLGALLYTFERLGTNLALLSLTRGEASRLNSTYERLETVRLWELRVAARLLGISSVAVADYPDGKLGSCAMAALTERVGRAIREQAADLLLVIDPAEAGADEAAVAMAARSAAERAGVPVVARTVSAARRAWQVDLGDEAVHARAAQRSAVAAHASQSEGLAELTARLELPDRTEWLLVPPPVPATTWTSWARPSHSRLPVCLFPG